MTKKYTLSEYYELQNEILKLRISINNGDWTIETRRRLQSLERELELILPQISRDIESGEIDYGTHLTRIK